jgi:hypothetical protein
MPAYEGLCIRHVFARLYVPGAISHRSPLPSISSKRTAVTGFLRRLLMPIPKASMPDPSLERCSTCFFPTDFHEVPLIGVKQYNYDTKIFTFGLPEGGLVHWHNLCE